VLNGRASDPERLGELALGRQRLPWADEAKLDVASNLFRDGLVSPSLLDSLETDTKLTRDGAHAVPPATAGSSSGSTSRSTERTVSAVRSTMSESSSSVDVNAGAMRVWSPA